MAYTRSAYNAADADFSEQAAYTRPGYDSADAQFGSAGLAIAYQLSAHAPGIFSGISVPAARYSLSGTAPGITAGSVLPVAAYRLNATAPTFFLANEPISLPGGDYALTGLPLLTPQLIRIAEYALEYSNMEWRGAIPPARYASIARAIALSPPLELAHGIPRELLQYNPIELVYSSARELLQYNPIELVYSSSRSLWIEITHHSPRGTNQCIEIAHRSLRGASESTEVAHATARAVASSLESCHRVTRRSLSSLERQHRAERAFAFRLEIRHRAERASVSCVESWHQASRAEATHIERAHMTARGPTTAAEAVHFSPRHMIADVEASYRLPRALLTTNPIEVSHRAQRAMQSASVRIMQPAPTIIHAGRDLSPLSVSLARDTGQTPWSATVELSGATDWLPIRIGDTLTLTIGDVTIPLIADQLQLDRAADSYRVQALSPIAKKGEPWAAPVALGATGMARAVCERLLGQLVDWRLCDWPLPAAAALLEATPLALAQQIVAAVGGTLECALDGQVIARRIDPISPPDYSTSEPIAVLTDDDLVARSDSVGSSQIANRYRITSDDNATQPIQIESGPDPADPDNLYRKQVLAYPYPWRPVTLAHTGDSATRVGAHSDSEQSHDELIEIIAGQGRTTYPVSALNASAYQYADLGAIDTDGTEVKTALADYSQLAITYRSRARRWIVTHERDETIQFLALETIS